MSTDTLLHLLEIVVLGTPLWWGGIRLVNVLREYPPHRHVNGKIEYPKGMEPPVVRPLER
jgi:hypothetical protein